jgi:hypothetical protein
MLFLAWSKLLIFQFFLLLYCVQNNAYCTHMHVRCARELTHNADLKEGHSDPGGGGGYVAWHLETLVSCVCVCVCVCVWATTHKHTMGTNIWVWVTIFIYYHDLIFKWIECFSNTVHVSYGKKERKNVKLS